MRWLTASNCGLSSHCIKPTVSPAVLKMAKATGASVATSSVTVLFFFQPYHG